MTTPASRHARPGRTQVQPHIGLLIRSFVVLQLCVFTLFARPAAAQAPSGPPDIAQIDAFIETALRERGVPGAALAIVHGDEIVHLRGFGKADNGGRAVTPQTPFRIGSLTKSFTALAIMQLVERGSIDLAAPVQRYLPWFRVADGAASAQITVAHLLYQTSGIPSDANAETLADPTLTLEQNVRELRTVALDRPVGSAYAYANQNFNTLGLLVEAVSGQSYADYMEQHILQPLDMQHSFATPQSMGQGELAAGYQWFFGQPVATADRFIAAHLPAGFLSASAEDLGHYLIAQMNGGRYGAASILSPAGIATMHSAGPNATFSPTDPDAGAYAMGWVNGQIYDVPAVWHNGDDSRFGGLMVMAKHGWGMVLLLNSSNPLSELEPTEYIFSGATHLLAGLEPVATGLPSLGSVYLVMNSILLPLSILLVVGALRLPHWERTLHQTLPTRPAWRTLLTAVRSSSEIGLALAILLLVPQLFSSWALLFFGVPDLALWLLVAASVLLASGLAHGLLLARALIRARGINNGQHKPASQT